MKMLPAMVWLALALAGAACARKPKDAATIEPLRAVIEANLSAMQRGDTIAVMATIHPESPDYSQTVAAVEGIAKMPVAFKFEKVEITSADEREAKVDYIQLTSRTSSAFAFRDNRVTGTHLLRKDKGAWKIYATRIRKLEYLDP